MSKISYPTTKELVALRFEREADFNTSLDFYLENSPNGYIALGGRDTIVILRDDSGWLLDKLKSRGIGVETIPVDSSSELPPSEATALRNQRGRVPDLDRKKVIQELRERYKSLVTIAK